jgi:hypothetical protein
VLRLLIEFLFVHFLIVHVESLSHLSDCSLIALLLGTAKDFLDGDGWLGDTGRNLGLPNAGNILFNEVLLEFGPLLAVVAPIVDVVNQLSRAHGLHKLFKLAVVAMRAVRHLVVKRHVAVVLVVPACQDNEDGGLFLIACVDTKVKPVTYS